MDSTGEIITGNKGQTVCRPSTWTDVILFFAFNYGLHVFTMLSPPGSTPFYDFTTALLALLHPYSGILTALRIIYQRLERAASGDLHIAHRAGALCMVIQGDRKQHTAPEFVVLPSRNVHGQYPSRTSIVPGDDNESAQTVVCHLLIVPQSFTVTPPRNSGPTPLRLTYNYSILKGVAGIIQILSGSFGLYQVSQRQLSKFGYASYSLTVVPYILMSFVNVLATLCKPQYPSMYLVIYRGVEPQTLPPMANIPPVLTSAPESPDGIAAVKSEPTASPAAAFDSMEAHVIGAVGEAYGDLSTLDKWVVRPDESTSRWLIPALFIATIICIVAPYIITLLLTGFHAGQSTRSQRAWLMAWLVIGQFYGFPLFMMRNDDRESMDFGADGINLLFLTLMLGTAAIGGFVVVGQMILNDALCIVI